MQSRWADKKKKLRTKYRNGNLNKYVWIFASLFVLREGNTHNLLMTF